MLSRASLLLLAALPALVGVAGGEVVSVLQSRGGPEFGQEQTTALVAPRGAAVTFNCTILKLYDKIVSWVRSRDLQILSHAGIVFTADSRVSVSAPSDKVNAGVHSLTISELRLSDSGRYECQLNTEPKMSRFFNLTVVDEAAPALVVWGRGARAHEGGAVTLTCGARYEPAPRALRPPPLDVRFYRASKPLDLLSSRGGAALVTERWAARVEARLTLGALRRGDEGVYTCVAGTSAADLLLEVLPATGAGPEAMQRDAPHSAAARGRDVTWLAPLLLVLLLR